MANNPVRVRWCVIYSIVGIISLVLFWIIKTPPVVTFIKKHSSEIFWCLSWAAIGIGLGLYNSRPDSNKRYDDPKHYYTYFLFVWFVSALSAFVALGDIEKMTISAYATAALTGIVIGFVGDKLPDRILGIK